MSKTVPNVDSSVFPRLAVLVSEYASRYERRPDGSDLCEGRVRDAVDLTPAERWEEIVVERPGVLPWLEQQRALPSLVLPDGYAPIAHPNPFISYYGCPKDRAIVAKQAGDLFIIHHALEERYWLETELICEAPRRAILRPRDVLPGDWFTSAPWRQAGPLAD